MTRSGLSLGLAFLLLACARPRPMTDDGKSSTRPASAPVATTAAPSAVPSGPHAGYRAARDGLERAESFRAKGDLDGARRELDAALGALGKDYAPPAVEDDTSQKLAASDELWNQGRRDDAIATRVRMLRTRLGLYVKRYPDAPPEPRALRVSLVVPPRSKLGEPLKLTVRLESVGSAPVSVNSRLALNAAGAPDEMKELVFDVKGPDGKLRDFLVKMKIGGAKPDAVRTLAPGEHLDHDYELSKFFDLTAPGEYSVSPLYASAPLADATGRPVWTELVYGESVRFTREK